MADVADLLVVAGRGGCAAWHGLTSETFHPRSTSQRVLLPPAVTFPPDYACLRRSRFASWLPFPNMLLVGKVVADQSAKRTGDCQILGGLNGLEAARRRADPYREMVQAIVCNKDMIGTAPLLDLLNMPKTTGNARRIGQTMRSLGFVPIKSRRLMPGGYRDTVTRGWVRPFRDAVAGEKNVYTR